MQGHLILEGKLQFHAGGETGTDVGTCCSSAGWRWNLGRDEISVEMGTARILESWRSERPLHGRFGAGVRHVAKEKRT